MTAYLAYLNTLLCLRALIIGLVMSGCLTNAPTVKAAEIMADEQLAEVAGRDGIGLAIHLEINSGLLRGLSYDSRITMGFNNSGTTTYAIVQNYGGIMDLLGMSLDARVRPDGAGDYLDFTLPMFVGFQDYGFRALAAQTDPTAPITSSYGQILLNGLARVQGHVLLWSR